MKRNEIIRTTGVCNSGVLSDMEMPKSYWEIHAKADEAYEKLIKVINGNKKILEVFEKFEKAKGDLAVEENEIFYSEGFRLGVLLGMDIANTEK